MHQTDPTVSDKIQFALKERHPPKLSQRPITPMFVFSEDVICSTVNSTLAVFFFFYSIAQ